MPELTADVVLRKIKTGEKVERADLRGLAMPKALLEGVSFRRCDLDGANLEGARLAKALFNNASLREAFLAGADLRRPTSRAPISKAPTCRGPTSSGANLNRANLEGANLQGADLAGARLTHAQLGGRQARAAPTSPGRQLAHADLSEADLSTAKLDEADLTNADLSGANLEEASLQRAKMRDTRTQGANLKNANLTGADAPGLLAKEGAGAIKRYFGKGDVLRNAHLEFDSGASVEIESLFEQCQHRPGRGHRARGRQGRGPRRAAESRAPARSPSTASSSSEKSPGITGVRQLVVSAGGSLVGDGRAAADITPVRVRARMHPADEDQEREAQAKPAERAQQRREAAMRRTQDARGRRNPVQGVDVVELPDRGEGARRGRPAGACAVGQRQRRRPRQGEGRRAHLRGRARGRVRRRRRAASPGMVKDNTVIRAKSLEVKLAPASGKMQVIFGECAARGRQRAAREGGRQARQHPAPRRGRGDQRQRNLSPAFPTSTTSAAASATPS